MVKLGEQVNRICIPHLLGSGAWSLVILKHCLQSWGCLVYHEWQNSQPSVMRQASGLGVLIGNFRLGHLYMLEFDRMEVNEVAEWINMNPGFWTTNVTLPPLKYCLSKSWPVTLKQKKSGLPWWRSGKESTSQCRRRGVGPWVGKVFWRRKWQPTPVFLPGESHRQRSLVGYRPLSHKRVRHGLATKQQTHYLLEKIANLIWFFSEFQHRLIRRSLAFFFFSW